MVLTHGTSKEPSKFFRKLNLQRNSKTKYIGDYQVIRERPKSPKYLFGAIPIKTYSQ